MATFIVTLCGPIWTWDHSEIWILHVGPVFSGCALCSAEKTQEEGWTESPGLELGIQNQALASSRWTWPPSTAAASKKQIRTPATCLEQLMTCASHYGLFSPLFRF